MTRNAILGGIVRVCSIFSALAWITVLWVLGSILIVTLPLATVALIDAVSRLLDGESPSWRRFARVMWERASATVFALAILAVPAGLSAALLWAAREGAGAMASGAGMAALALTAVIAVVAPYACLTAAEPSAVPRRIGFLIATRPGRVLLSVTPWAAMAFLIVIAPSQISLVIAVVSVSLPALGSVAILTTGLTAARAEPRARGTRSILQVTSKGITE